MTKHIILIHGRGLKPAQSRYETVMRRALERGLELASPSHLERFRSGEFKFSLIYYGDYFNWISSTYSDYCGGVLNSNNDPDMWFDPCIDFHSHEAALENAIGLEDQNEELYSEILANFDSRTDLDDIIRKYTDLIARGTRSKLNYLVIRSAKRDLGEYFKNEWFAEQVRERLRKVYDRATHEEEDVCIISHSAGCIVAWDTFQKMSWDEKYTLMRKKKPSQVNLWLTLGCPLGEPGVQANLLYAKGAGAQRHPRNIVSRWVNLAAHDDHIAHDFDMKDDFETMIGSSGLKEIIDEQIYNCWTFGRYSKPHALGGYLAHRRTGQYLTQWMDQ